MVLIDSDVFILDLFYPEDARTGANRQFLSRDIAGRATTVFNVLEVCGIVSFNKSSEDVKSLFYDFHRIYNLNVLYPNVLFPSPGDVLKHIVARTFARILLKMNFSDALILTTAESFDVSTLVTWNVRHFENRTSMQVVTPEDYL